jgi:hypothetical protein
MLRPARAEFPPEFASVRQELDAWRASGTRHRKLPDRLWEQAVLLARKHGLNRTKSALGLDYYSLKRRVEKSGGQAGDINRAEDFHFEVDRGLLHSWLPPATSLQPQIKVWIML